MTSAAQLLKTALGPIQEQPEISETLELAQEINQYVRGIIEIIPNYMSQCVEKWETRKKSIDWEQKHVTPDDYIAGKWQNEFMDAVIKKAHLENHEPIVEDLAEIAKQQKIGNCVVMSALGFQYAKDHGHRIEIITMKNGGHTFLVLNRDQHTKPVKYLKWGDQAVVCDPWFNTAYPASEIPSKLYYFYEQKYDGTLYFTRCWPFDPLIHKLEIYDIKKTFSHEQEDTEKNLKTVVTA